MQSAAFFAFHRLTHNQISYVDHITQFANLSGGYAAFEQAFSFFVNDIQSVPGNVPECTGVGGILALG